MTWYYQTTKDTTRIYAISVWRREVKLQALLGKKKKELDKKGKINLKYLPFQESKNF